MMFSRSHHFTDFRFRTDITRVNPQTVSTEIGHSQSNFIVEVNISHQRNRDLLTDFTKSLCGFHAWYRYPHDVCTSINTALNLRNRCSDITGFGIGHTLNADWRITAHID